MADRKIYLASPTMHGDEQRFVQEAFDTNWVAPLGPNVNGFEEEMAAYAGTSHAAALDSGTAALHLAMKLLGVQEGDYVMCSSLTFAASCNPITYEKATPVFIDSEPGTWNMSPEALRRALEKYPHPKAVECVHLYGTPARIDEIMEICEEYGVPFLEDAAESLGSTYSSERLGQTKMTGTFGRFGAYSFNGNKIITTSGGGMLVSGDGEAIQKARFLSTQARDPARWYQHSRIGYNYRMSNITAGIGRGQLLHIGEHITRKREIYETYRNAFADIDAITLNPMNPRGEANCWLTGMVIDRDCPVTPDQVMDALQAANIESRPIWKPMHLQPVYADAPFFADPQGAENGTGSVSADIFERGLCLPSDIKNTPEEMEEIIGIVRGLFC
ncbi:MAG: DegT/DnrJ/EryC1/StrS family aminotransferase [Eubacteriales bacterium]|nr:DegT/DnrJ/EryC1/StrS family aminotransferase [Eubacteriales bacterium]